MGVQLSLNPEVTKAWPLHIPQLRPMLVKKNGQEGYEVAMRVGDSCVWFEPGSIGTCGMAYEEEASLRYLKGTYSFIRYLNTDETVTFSGCDF